MGFFSRRVDSWTSPNLGGPMEVVAYGGYGKPLLFFPTAAEDAGQLERQGMIAALAPAIDAGRLKVYCVESINGRSWLNPGVAGAERLAMQNGYDRYLCEEVVPYIRHDCRSSGIRLATAGAGFGAFHAFNSLCRHPDLFDEVTAMSGVFDLDPYAAGAPRDESYLHNPMAYLPNLDDHYFLPMLRERCAIRILTGDGAGENPEESRRISAVMTERGIPHNLELWGPEAGPGWPTWRAMMHQVYGAAPALT